MALLVCVLALPACGGTAGNQPAAARPVTIEALAPKGPVAWPFAFEWKTTAPATAICRVTIFDASERQLYQFETKGTRLQSPEDLRKLLAATRRFLWKVAVIDGNGNESARSALAAFQVL